MSYTRATQAYKCVAQMLVCAIDVCGEGRPARLLRKGVDWAGEAAALGMDKGAVRDLWTPATVCHFYETRALGAVLARDQRVERVAMRIYEHHRAALHDFLRACLDAYFCTDDDCDCHRPMHELFDWECVFDCV